ncbi:multicopper oxidase family protein [Brevibacillus marinus]|uniref:multicopper oxidase family protein n=1 Tax=Brevibacillus marinus TaxID=2496837 RepID=UPI000F83614C|nr:multicopper oxidase family protein [Brevibacillus marinus]
MIEAFLGSEFIVLLGLVLLWGGTSFSANQIKYALNGGGNVHVWRNITRIGSWAGIALFLLWVVIICLILAVFGWYFVIDRFLVVLPLLALPVCFVITAALPKLKNAAGLHPNYLVAVLVPVHVMLAGSMIAFYLVTLDVPAIPDGQELTIYLAILAVTAVLLWFYHKRRLARILLHQPGILRRMLRGAGCTATFVGVLASWYAWSLETSKFPGSLSMVNHEVVDFGGGTVLAPPGAQGHDHSQPAIGNNTVSVTDLTGPKTGEPDKRFTLYAEKKAITLSSGKTIEAWTFNGQTPGPPIVVQAGDVVEVKLVNKDIEQGVTVHWHGVDVPNAEDGVAGMTQNAVMPGESHTYRFRVEEAGSHWYHSHQTSSIQVQKGLFGPFIILPEKQQDSGDMLDITTVVHDWDTPQGTVTTLDAADTLQTKAVKRGTKVRLRLINSSSLTKVFALHGTSYQVVAIDGEAIHQPGELSGQLLKIGGGGRYDLVFTMPDDPVTLHLYGENTDATIVFSEDGRGKASYLHDGEVFDPTTYGTPAPTPFSPVTSFDREFVMILDQLYLGNYNGKTSQLWAINGEVFPNTPTFMVQEGDIVKTTIVNRSFADHPMHLHGHHMHVLSKNGKPLSGSPLVLDTLLVEPGDIYEVAFLADNPGLWMDHCHNLEHAALGMTMHLAYENVTTPFTIGTDSGNHPE